MQLIKVKGDHYILVEGTANLRPHDFVYHKRRFIKVVSDLEKWKNKKVQRVTHSTHPIEIIQEEGFIHWGNIHFLYGSVVSLVRKDDIKSKAIEYAIDKAWEKLTPTFTNSFYIAHSGELVAQHPELIRKYMRKYYVIHFLYCLIRLRSPFAKTKWNCKFTNNGNIELI